MKLDWIKQFRTGRPVGFSDPGNPGEEEVWGKTEKAIKDRYPEDFQKINKHGFTGLPMDQRAVKVGEAQSYCVLFRSFSRNVHSSDYVEQRARLNKPELSDFWENLQNLGLCAAQDALLHIAKEANGLFDLGATERLDSLQVAHETLGRKTRISG